jgi:hypothetical protein
MGSGFKTFTATSVLTAADLNNYCQSQSVMYFASETARDIAITSPVDGMVAYVGSNDSSEGIYTFNGTAWRKGPGWNAPWGFIQYTQTTSAVSVKNGNILVGNTISVVNRRRYRIHAQIRAFASTVINDVAELSIVVGGTTIAGTRVTNTIANFSGFGGTVVAYYTATATNSALACNLYNNAIVPAGTHTFDAAATVPIFIAVEDIGPSGAPA